MPSIDAVIRPTLHAYLATIARSIECKCFRVGGVADHVHLAVQLARTTTTAKLVEILKTSSAKWLKAQSPALTGFAWQRGYAVFSVRPTDLEALRHYIDTQAAHHTTRTFEDEYRALLNKNDVSFDERYVWD